MACLNGENSPYFLWFSYGLPMIFPSKTPFAAGILPLLTLSDLWDLLDAEADLLGRLVLVSRVTLPHSTSWCPPVISWFINPMNTIVIRCYKYHKTIVIGVMFNNLAIDWGPHDL